MRLRHLARGPTERARNADQEPEIVPLAVVVGFVEPYPGVEQADDKRDRHDEPVPETRPKTRRVRTRHLILGAAIPVLAPNLKSASISVYLGQVKRDGKHLVSRSGGFPVAANKLLSADGLFALIRAGFERVPDRRAENARISLPDALMSGFAMFSLKDPSLLAFDECRATDSNLKSIYGIEQVPGDTHMRTILDDVEPAGIRPNTVQLRRTMASWNGLDGCGHWRCLSRFNLNFDILRLTTRGLERLSRSGRR